MRLFDIVYLHYDMYRIFAKCEMYAAGLCDIGCTGAVNV